MYDFNPKENLNALSY